MARKVFISFLGKSNYSPCVYTRDEYKSQSIRFIQEATLEYINSKTPWTKDDVAYILLTKDAETANWVDNGQIDRDTKQPIELEGLKTRISNLHYPLEIRTIEKLPIGNNESEIWEIFEKLFAVINDDDELYFDLTHGFRYLPMLVLVCGNYSKFLRKVSVKSITYGNFEYTEKEKPIVDLLPLSQLQDWTYAAADYIENGNVNKLSSLSDSDEKLVEFTTALKNVIGERQTCRGIDIIKSTSFNMLKSATDNIKNTKLTPLPPIIDKIRSSFTGFDEKENIKNGFQSAIWCFNNKLYQQSITILLETIISDICIHNEFDWQTRKYRDNVVSATKIVIDKIPESGWKTKEDKESTKGQREMERLRKIKDSERLKFWIELYAKIEILRNDIDHAGMRSNAKSLKEFVKELGECIENLKSKIVELC